MLLGHTIKLVCRFESLHKGHQLVLSVFFWQEPCLYKILL
jgi:hypothetical protein